MDNLKNTWFYDAELLLNKLPESVKIIPAYESEVDGKLNLKIAAKFRQTKSQWIAENPEETKIPLFATRDLDEIEEWAQRFPAYAIVTGEDLVVLDADVGKGKKGKETMKWLFSKGLPKDILTVYTPSGGAHFYFYTPLYPVIQTGVCVDIEHDDINELLDQINGSPNGLDVRHGNAFCIGPGSKRQAGSYQIKDKECLKIGRIPSNIKIARKKEKLKIQDEFTLIQSRDNDWFFSDELVKEGERNDFATRFTYHLAHENVTQSEALMHLNRLSRRVGEGVSKEEIQSMYDRAVGKQKENPLRYYEANFYECDYKDGRGWFCASTQTVKSHANRVHEYANDKTIINEKGKTVNIFDCLKVSKTKRKLDDLSYVPGKPSVYYDEDGKLIGNTCIPWETDIPIDDSIDVNKYVSAFKEVFNNVMGEHGPNFMRWVLAAYYAPDVRPEWSPYILSRRHGVGKDLIFDVVMSLFGEDNATSDNIKAFSEQFNRTLFNYTLIVFSDFKRVHESDRANIKQDIKRLMTTYSSQLEEKGVDKKRKVVRARYLFSNNDDDSMEVDKEDRRLFVVLSEAYPLDQETYRTAAKCWRREEYLRVSKEERQQCKARIVEWFKEESEMTIQECVHFVRGRAPHTAAKEVVQRDSENIRIKKTRQAIDYAFVQEPEDGAILYRGDRVFFSAVVTKASLEGFLRYEIGNTRCSVETYISELERERIIERVRSGRNNELSYIQAPSEKFYIKDSIWVRVTQGRPRGTACWVVSDIWKYHKPKVKPQEEWTRAVFSREYKKLFERVDDHEPMVLDLGDEIEVSD